MPLFSYVDESEHLRGPFEGVQMHYWYQKGYLPSTLRIFVHYGLYGRSNTLEELRRRNGDLNPFLEVTNWRLNPTRNERLRTNVMVTGNLYEPSSSSLDSDSHSSLPCGLKNVKQESPELPAEELSDEGIRNYKTGASNEDHHEHRKMPYPKFECPEEDPEEIAEREFEKKRAELGLPDSRPARKSLPSAPQPSPIRPTSKHPKEAKALRKKRNRGISGSSIKKDGGRFELGLDDYIFDEDVDEHTEDIEQDVYNEFIKPTNGSFSSRSIGFGSMESDSEASNDSANVRPKNDQMVRVKDLLLAALSPDDDGSSEQSLVNVFSEEYDETGRVKLLHDAITAICNRREEVVDDPMFEYRLVTTVSKLIQQELLRSSTVDSYVQCVQSRDHGWELLNAATVKLPKDWDADVALKGIEKLATELATEYDTKDVAEDLSGRNVPFFHANFVSQFCLDAIFSMNMDVIYFATNALKDFLDHGALSPWSVNIGFERFFKNIHSAEMDLPGATSLATMLMSYAANDVMIIDDPTAATCPKPARFIKVGPQGKLSVVDNGHEECSEMNYFIMGQ